MYKRQITQNIDGLHQSAGSKMVLELHGTVHKNRCMRCGRTYALDAILKSEGLPRCKLCGGLIKPCVTLYGEPLPAVSYTHLITIEKGQQFF